MIPQKYRYYLKRFQEIGFATASHLLYHKLKKHSFIKKKREFAQYRRWSDLSQKHQLGSFDHYFEKLRSLDFFDKMIIDPEFTKTWPEQFLDQSTGPTISLLGFGKYSFNPGSMPWHTDITVDKPSPESWKTSFYCDVKTQEGFDIKIPWELSRFQHLFPLGLQFKEATQLNNHKLIKKYSHIFETNISDWIEKNPYLIGVNWVCPMEVGIRAINLVWGFHFFKNSPYVSQDFWKKFICVLFHHAEYLQSNWEVSDKPNNHYLADLLGYLYVSNLLIGIKIIYQTKKWVIKEIKQQLDHQILPDGTSYEGSTAYHRLDTEMVLHFMLLSKYTDTISSHTFFEKKFNPSLSPTPLSGDPGDLNALYQKMLMFLHDCHDTGGNLIQIGDNDSGEIVVGIHPAHVLRQAQDERRKKLVLKLENQSKGTIVKKNKLKNQITKTPLILSLSKDMNKKITTYPDFGLSIIKSNNWHITFRHPTYKKHQPTGHFHQDLLSFTLSIDGIPIIVDPGSYCYTADPKMRNDFRSARLHNTFYLQEKTWGNIDLEEIDLFQMPRLGSTELVRQARQHEGKITIQDSHEEYSFCGLTPYRKLEFDEKKEELIINDWILSSHKDIASLTWIWSLNFGPAITLERLDYTDKKWLVKKKERPLVVIETSHDFTLRKTHFSPIYGSKEISCMLTASADTRIPQKIIIKRS